MRANMKWTKQAELCGTIWSYGHRMTDFQEFRLLKSRFWFLWGLFLSCRARPCWVLPVHCCKWSHRSTRPYWHAFWIYQLGCLGRLWEFEYLKNIRRIPQCRMCSAMGFHFFVIILHCNVSIGKSKESLISKLLHKRHSHHYKRGLKRQIVNYLLWTFIWLLREFDFSFLKNLIYNFENNFRLIETFVSVAPKPQTNWT